MARIRSRKSSAWNKAVKSAFAKGAKNLKAAVKVAKKTYKPKSATRKSATRKSAKRCAKGSHRRMRGKGSRCVKH